MSGGHQLVKERKTLWCAGVDDVLCLLLAQLRGRRPRTSDSTFVVARPGSSSSAPFESFDVSIFEVSGSSVNLSAKGAFLVLRLVRSLCFSSQILDSSCPLGTLDFHLVFR